MSRKKEGQKKLQCKSFMYRDKTNVELGMCDDTGNNWNHRNSNKRFKEKIGSHCRENFR